MNSKTVLTMLLGCVAVIALALLLTSQGINAGWLIFLLCPLMHILMMGGHHHGNHEHHDNKVTEEKHL